MFSTTVSHSPASGPGALDGFAVACSCGARFTTSLGEAEAQRQAAEHLAWHERQARPAELERAAEARDEAHVAALGEPAWRRRQTAALVREVDAAIAADPRPASSLTAQRAIAAVAARHGVRPGTIAAAYHRGRRAGEQ